MPRRKSYKEQSLTFKIACVCMYICFHRTGFSNYTSQVLSSVHLYLKPQCSSLFFFLIFLQITTYALISCCLTAFILITLSTWFPSNINMVHSLSLSNIYLSVDFSKKLSLTTLKSVILLHFLSLELE